MAWLEAYEMIRRAGHNYLTVFADLIAKRVLIAPPRKRDLGLGAICCGIAAAKWAFEGGPFFGYRHERRLREGRQG